LTVRVAGKVVALLGLSIPGFWLGLVLILMFSVWLEWLPTGGKNDWHNLVMPSLALGWYFAASLLRLTRSSMLEVMRSEYIKLARLKGLPGYVVIAKHGFKNALVPVLTLAGVNLVVMVNAAVIIEVACAATRCGGASRSCWEPCASPLRPCACAATRTR
jgi:peptide/nickel transport system permease protein